jgi:hypothetical protein
MFFCPLFFHFSFSIFNSPFSIRKGFPAQPYGCSGNPSRFFLPPPKEAGGRLEKTVKAIKRTNP